MPEIALRFVSVFIAPLVIGIILLTAVPVRGQAPATAPADSPSPSAGSYYRWLAGCLDAMEKDMPAITASAEAAAKGYIQDGWEIGVWGEAGMAGEFNGRAGGLIRTSDPKEIEKADWKGIVLFFPREESLAADLARAKEFRKRGNLVVCFGSDAVGKVGGRTETWDAMIDTHAASTGGLFRAADGAYLVPTDPPANIAAVWTWTGEFVAALTRLGKMPAMHQSIMVPGALERLDKLKGLKFQAEAPKPVPAGQLGREYLAEVRKSLTAIHEQEMARIAAVALQAADILKAGHKAHIFAHGHALGHHVGIEHDAGYFHQVNRGLFELKKDHGIAPGDFVFCLGYDRVFEGWYFHDATTRMRAAGATFAWSMTDYNNQLDANIGPSALPKGETVIGQHWAFGDAVASVPGYDVKILPPSGVIAEAILWMTEAEMLAKKK